MSQRLPSKIYPTAYVTGPKFSKSKERYYVNIWCTETKTCLSMLYSRFLMQEYLQRELSSDECVDHKDENPLNDTLDNLQVLTRGQNTTKSQTKYIDIIQVQCILCDDWFEMTPKQQRQWTGNSKRQAGPFCSRSCCAKFGALQRR